MTDYQKKKLASIVKEFAFLRAGNDGDSKRCAQAIVPIIRDAVIESTPNVNRHAAGRVAKELVFFAAIYVAGTANFT